MEWIQGGFDRLRCRRGILLTILLTERVEPVATGGLGGTSGTSRRPWLLVLMTRLTHLERDLVTS
jgi:hypothetical protein